MAKHLATRPTQLFVTIILAAFSAWSQAEFKFPELQEPVENPSNQAKIDLGRGLFSDTSLSIDSTYSCASCHDPEQHFTDGLKVAVGVHGQLHSRNTPSLYNVGYNPSFGWDDQQIEQLEDQHLVPLLSTDPLEMGFDQTKAAEVLANTNQALWHQAFGDDLDSTPPIGLISRAIAAYLRTLKHPDNDFDRYVFADAPNALTMDAKAGFALFTSPRLGCGGCHSGFNFAGPQRTAEQSPEPLFHITGVAGSTKAFKTPSLRAVAFTAPYMHAGNLDTLEDVIDHYETTDAEEIPNFQLTDKEREQLIAFLRSL